MFRHCVGTVKVLRSALPRVSSVSSCVLIALMIFSSLGSRGAAAVLSWDGDGIAPLGADGSWNLSAPNWLNQDNAYQAWDNSGNDDAVFGTVAGNVDVSSATVNVHSLSFDVSGYALSGSGAINLSGTSPSISAAGDVLAIISTTLTGTSGLQKTGSGYIELKGSNTYSGTTTVSDGVLRLSNANAVPGGTTSSGGTSNLNIAGGVVELTDVAMVISRSLGAGASQVQFTGSGGFSAYNNNPIYSSVTTGVWLNSGTTLTWGSGGFVPDGSELLLSSDRSNACVDFQNPINLGSSLRTVRVADGSSDFDAIISGAMSGSGGLSKAGDGCLSISATNSYTGPTIIAGGVLSLSKATALPGGIDTTGGTSNLTLAGGVLQLYNGQTFSRSLGTAASQVQFSGSGGFSAYGSNSSVNLGGGSATVVWGANGFVPDGARLLLGSKGSNATLDFRNPIDLGSSLRTIEVRRGSAASDAKLSGVLSGTAGFEKTGPGILELTAANSYTGPTVVSGGTLLLSNANAIPGGIAVSGGTSNIVLAGGVIGLRDADFFRALGTGPDQVQFSGSGGFTCPASGTSTTSSRYYYSSTRTQIVNLGGQSAAVAWGVGGFVPDGAALILGTTGASGVLDFQNPLDLGNSSQTIQVDGVSPDNSSPPLGCALLSGGVSGNGGLTKSGNGVLKLTTANTYCGETCVTGGILQLAHPQALPGGIGVAGGTSHLSISGGGAIGLDCGDFQRNLGSGPTEVQFSGSGGFVAGANRIVNFGGASAPVSWDNNPYFPDDLTLVLESTISDGPMEIQNPLILGAGKRTVSTSAGSGDVQARLSGTISGVGGLRKTGTLVLELTAANTYTGQTEVQCGILRLSNPQALPGGIGSSGGTSNLNFTGSDSSGGSHHVSSDSPTPWSFWSAYGGVGPVLELATGDFTRSLGTGPAQVQFTGSGGFSAYGANRAVNLGGSSAQVVWGQSSFVPSDSSLRLSSYFSNATVDFQNPIDLGTSVRTIDVSNGGAAVDARLSGALSGTGGLFKSGNGTLELTAANTYSGQTTVQLGALRLSNSLALPGGTGATGGTSNLLLQWGIVELASGDFLRGYGTAAEQVRISGYGGFAAVGANRIVNLGGNSATITTFPSNPLFPSTLILASVNSTATLDFQNPLNMTAFSETFQVDNGTAAIDAKLSGALSGSGGLTKTNGGTLELTVANAYTGQTQIQGGALRLSNPLALPGGCGSTGGTSNLSFYGGVLELASGDFFRGAGTAASQVQFSALDGGFAAIGANRIVNLGGNSAPLSWGYNSFAPWVLVLGSPNADATVDFQNPIEFGGGLQQIRADNGSAAIDGKLSGVLSGTQPLTKAGSGTLQLTAANTYSGALRLSAGRLLVDGSLASALVTVASGAALGGTGTVGQVTVSSGGHLAPGDAVGVLTLTNSLTLASGALLDFDLASPGGSDLVSMPTSTLTLDGQQFADFLFVPQAGFVPGIYTLIDAGDIQGSLGGSLSGTIAGRGAWISTSNGNLLLTVVPEPSTIALVGIGAIGLFAYVLRRRKGFVQTGVPPWIASVSAIPFSSHRPSCSL
jgi:autotransporter-associated beta strand protein